MDFLALPPSDPYAYDHSEIAEQREYKHTQRPDMPEPFFILPRLIEAQPSTGALSLSADAPVVRIT